MEATVETTQTTETNAPEQIILPLKDFNPLNPVNNAIYDDELYAAEQAKKGAQEGEITPSQETQQTQTQLEEQENNPAAPAATESTTEETTPTSANSFEDLLKERSAGKYNKWEEVESVLNQAATATPALDESAKKFLSYITEGKTQELERYLAQERILSTLNEMTPEERIKLKMMTDHPEFDQDDIEDEYNIRYRPTIGEDDPNAELLKKRAERAIKIADSEALAHLNKLKEELTLPDLKSLLQEEQGTDDITSFNKEIEDLGKQFSESLQKDIPNFKELDLSIADKDVSFDYKYQIEDKERTDLGGKAQDLWAYYNSRYYKDGKFDTMLRLRDIFIAENFPRLLKSAVTKALTEGRLTEIKNIANVDSKTTPVTAINAAEDAEREAVRQFILR